MPFRMRLIISSLLGAVPLIVLGIILLVESYLARRDLILNSNLSRAQLAAAFVGGWVDSHVRTLKTLAGSNEVQQGTRDDMQALVLRQLALQPDWDNLIITTADGMMIAGRYRPFTSIGDRDFFLQAKRTRRPVVSNGLIGRITGYRIVAIVYPIIRQGAFAGVVAASVRPQEIQQTFTSMQEGGRLIIALWGSDRRLIARTNTPEVELGRKFETPNFSVVISGRSGTLIAKSPVTGVETLIGYAPINNAPWAVVSATPLSDALTPLNRNLALFGLLSLLVLGSTFAWALYSSKTIARQVTLLVDSARAVGEGKFDTRIHLPGGGDLSDLADSLNKMAADLAVIDRLKSELLSMVSHELKTPLTTIRSFIDVLESGLVVPGEPRYQELLTIADRQARRLQDMIENLLSSARVEAGGLAVIPRPVTLAGIVNTSVRSYEDDLRERGLSLTVDVPEDIRVLADVPKVVLALNNLLDNAIKFTSEGGVTIHAAVEGTQAVVSVTDTGIGIAPEVRPHLFERFFQPQPLLTRSTGGAGLGLVVVKAIVEAHGGTVFVRSDGPGHGSTFGFTLPLAPADA